MTQTLEEGRALAPAQLDDVANALASADRSAVDAAALLKELRSQACCAARRGGGRSFACVVHRCLCLPCLGRTSTAPGQHLNRTWTAPSPHLNSTLTAPRPHLNRSSTAPQPHLDRTSTAPQPHLNRTLGAQAQKMRDADYAEHASNLQAVVGDVRGALRLLSRCVESHVQTACAASGGMEGLRQRQRHVMDPLSGHFPAVTYVSEGNGSRGRLCWFF
eukprot:363870-Chlamydomonas_euryale.AAC.3